MRVGELNQLTQPRVASSTSSTLFHGPCRGCGSARTCTAQSATTGELIRSRAGRAASATRPPGASHPAPAPAHLRDQYERWHVPAGADGTARTRDSGDDAALRHAGLVDPSRLLRRREDQGSPSPPTDHCRPTTPRSKVEWLQSEFLKTPVANDYCSHHLADEACPYANICEQCDNFVPAPENIAVLAGQFAENRGLHADAKRRGWGERGRSSRPCHRQAQGPPHIAPTSPSQPRHPPLTRTGWPLIEQTFGETRRRVKVIGRLPGERSALSLLFAVLDRAASGWRGITYTPAEVRLLQMVRGDLGLTTSRKEYPEPDPHGDVADAA